VLRCCLGHEQEDCPERVRWTGRCLVDKAADPELEGVGGDSCKSVYTPE